MAINFSGDLLTSGDILNPLLGATILDTGALSPGNPTRGYYNISITLNCTVSGSFVLGVYTGADVVVSTLRYSVLSGSGQSFSLNRVPIAEGSKFKIVVPLAIIGTANVSINIYLLGGE